MINQNNIADEGYLGEAVAGSDDADELDRYEI